MYIGIMFQQIIGIILVVKTIQAVQFPGNPTSEMSADEKIQPKANKTVDQSDESSHEGETEMEEKDKKYLDDAMRIILDPKSIILKNDDVIENFKHQLDELDRMNISLEEFMDEMDKLSLEVCKTSQKSLWSYVTDINNDSKKNDMVRILKLLKLIFGDVSNKLPSLKNMKYL